MSIEILKDIEKLRNKSEDVLNNNEQESLDIVKQMMSVLPNNSLGLSAPQIGIFKRIFILNYGKSPKAFVNPVLTFFNENICPSEEGCLSIPDVHKCVERHQFVSISSPLTIDINSLKINSTESTTVYRDIESFIIQHEVDHLNGILIIDKPEVETTIQRRLNKKITKDQKRNTRKTNKSNTYLTPSKKQINKKELKNKKQKERKRNRRLAEIMMNEFNQQKL